ALADPGLQPETLSARIERAACTATHFDLTGGTPAEALTRLLATLEEQSLQSVAQEDPGNWARQALVRVRDLIGTGGDSRPETPDWRKSRLGRALQTAAQKVAEEWDRELTGGATRLMEHPGRRVAAAGAALESLRKFCDESVASFHARFEQQAVRTQKAWQHLEGALEACLAGAGGGGWGLPSLLFGNRSRRLLRVFMDHLAAYGRQRLAEEVVHASQQFFAFLHARLGDRLRDLTFCRQRLRSLQESLEAPSVEE